MIDASDGVEEAQAAVGDGYEVRSGREQHRKERITTLVGRRN